MTCEKRSHTGLLVGSAVAAGGLLAAGAYAKQPPAKPPATPKPAPAVVHAGIPWWVYGLSALVLVALAVAATLLVVRLLRRRADRRAMAEKDRAWEQHERQRLGQRRRRPVAAIGAAPVKAQDWIDGKVDAR